MHATQHDGPDGPAKSPDDDDGELEIEVELEEHDDEDADEHDDDDDVEDIELDDLTAMEGPDA